jgi:hypothetical protein
MLPGWGEMILPPAHSRLRRATMLDKEKATPRLRTRRISCSAVWISAMLHIYCRLLTTELTDLERQYLHKRIAEEHTQLERLEKSRAEQQADIFLVRGTPVSAASELDIDITLRADEVIE